MPIHNPTISIGNVKPNQDSAEQNKQLSKSVNPTAIQTSVQKQNVQNKPIVTSVPIDSLTSNSSEPPIYESLQTQVKLLNDKQDSHYFSNKFIERKTGQSNKISH